MDVQTKGKPSFAHLHITLEPGESIITESDAMASMSAELTQNIKLNGGLINALLIKLFGSESIFMNIFSNESTQTKSLVVAPSTPGDLCEVKLNKEGIYIQPGTFVACTNGIQPRLRWAGFKSWLAKEGLFRIYVQGTGTLWYGAYGCIYPYELDGEYIVDSSHIVSYPKSVKLNIQLAGKGLLSSFFSGEGFVTRLQGKGTVYLQSRSIADLVSFLNRRI